MNINNYLHLLAILDSDSTLPNATDYNNVPQDMLDDAKRQCFVWSIKDAPSVLGRQYVFTIKHLYPLLYHIKKHVRKNNIVYISQTDKNLLPFYNNSQPKIHYAIHNVLIDKAKVLCDFNLPYTPHHEAKKYYVCLENLDTMLKLHKSIVSSQAETTPAKGEVAYQHIPAYFLLPSFNSDLGIHEDYSFEEIEEAIIKRYPCIPYYKKLVKKLNAHAINEDEIIKFDITANTSRKCKITKLKIRAFSGTCLLKSLEKQEKKCRLLGTECIINPNTRYREHYLNKRFGEWEEYDIKGSVPRVSRAMANQGDMGDLNEDIYRTIFEPFVKDYQLYFDETVTEWCESVRNFFKLFFMRLFFGGTPKQIVYNILSSERKERNKAIRDGVPADNLSPFSTLVENGVNLVSLIDKYQKRVFKVCHRTDAQKRDTSVFLHESCIYLEVRNELFKRGIEVVQVYDGFYFKKGTLPPDMDEIIQRAASKYYNINHEIAVSNAIQADINALRETPITTTNIHPIPSSISDSEIIETGIEFIKPKRKSKL